MAEKTLNSTLTGEEVIRAIADRVATSLRLDCYLNPTTSYDYYDARIHIELRLNDAGLRTVGVERHVVLTEGLEPETVTTHVSGELEIEMKAPNEERIETGQPVPVLTKDENGRSVVKHVQYAKKAVANKAKGA